MSILSIEPIGVVCLSRKVVEDDNWDREKGQHYAPILARLEKGDHRHTPTFDTIYKILKVLGYTMSINVQKKKKKRVA